ncbi:MAG: Ig-like domain-containing protein [Spirochaetes bacterium]|jgi:hypothetical protein|nr:Ig-like domain-containing protein [Spirochaetota bacterium]
MRIFTIWVLTLLLSIGLIIGCESDDGTDNAESIAPTVTSTIPAEGAVDIAINRNLVINFSEEMDSDTITDATVILREGTTDITGVVSLAESKKIATFNPDSNLKANTVYTAIVTTGAKDLAGNALADEFTLNFTTGVAEDVTAPTIAFTVPVEGVIDVALNKSVVITFKEEMDPLTITGSAFTLKQGATNIAGVVSLSDSGKNATFNPDSNLKANTVYTATVTTGVKDLAGNALADEFTLNFTSGTAEDLTAPTIASTVPAEDAIDVAVNSNVVITFSEDMDPLTITGSTITLKQGATNISGVVSLSLAGNIATFNPTVDLTTNTIYTTTVTTGAKDIAENALAAALTVSFTTGAAAALGPEPVNLGLAGIYVILAKSAVSTTGTTAIVGDIGLSPAVATYITGFDLTVEASGEYSTDTSIVTGRIYAADYSSPTPIILTTAISNMQAAYLDAADRPTPGFTELGAGDISAMTLAPGLYKWGTGVNIDDRGVTLSGDSNDVWIFQIDQDLSLASGAIITLSDGALAKNIFWQVAGAATLNTTAEFKGVLLCKTAIALKTGAKVNNGRLLAQTAVTLDSNAVTVTNP